LLLKGAEIGALFIKKVRLCVKIFSITVE
jgi:hypothetical protein